jgi:hypothetical protein
MCHCMSGYENRRGKLALIIVYRYVKRVEEFWVYGFFFSFVVNCIISYIINYYNYNLNEFNLWFELSS